MNWHKAHRNKVRAVKRRRTIRLPRRWFMRNPDVGWHEWLHTILPNLICDTSMIARLLRKPEPTPSNKVFSVPAQLPPFRGTRVNLEAYREAMQLPPIFDDIDYPDPPPNVGARIAFSRYWEIVPGLPLPTKQFIYGDNWVAFRRLN